MDTNKLKTILEMWEEFERETRPKNAPPIQTQEMRRAFYGGGGHILALLIAWRRKRPARFGLLLKKGVA